MESLAFVNTAYENIINFSLIFTRVFSMLYTISIFRREMATVRIVVSLALFLAFYALILTTNKVQTIDILSLAYVLQSIMQTLIGFCSGMIINIVLEIFVATGQVISLQIGLSTASYFDPKFGMITSLTQFYVITGLIIFFGMNGHLMVIDVIVNSFTYLPVTQHAIDFHLNLIIKYSSIIFMGGVVISLTIIAATLLTNICLAIMSKFAPQFNLFSVGLNMTLLIGLVCIYLTYHIVINRGSDYLQEALQQYQLYVNGLGSHE